MTGDHLDLSASFSKTFVDLLNAKAHLISIEDHAGVPFLAAVYAFMGLLVSSPVLIAFNLF